VTWTFVGVMFCFVFKFIVVKITQPIFHARLMNNPEMKSKELEQKAFNASDKIYRFLFVISAFIFGFFYMRKERWFPFGND
jgi:hypothetical protein